MARVAGSRLARDSVFSFLGLAVPLLAAVVAIPLLIRGLGTDRFGVLTLAWMFIGYFSLFDLGLGRALTQVLSERIGSGQDSLAPPMAWTALAMMFALGLVGTLIVVVTAPWLVHSILKIPDALESETLHAFYMLAIAIPIVVVTAGLVGILSAFHRFAVLSAIRAPLGIYMYVAPLAVLPFSHSLRWVTAVLVLGRLIACLVHLAFCMPLMAAPGKDAGFGAVRPLFQFGAWMTVTNVIGPLMLYLDRFVIGAVLSVAAVAYYATPYEMVTKLLILPAAILSVLFPAFAASHRHDPARLYRLFVRGTKYIALALFPVVLVIVAFAREGLQWWLGAEFAVSSTAVLQVLAIGIFVNSLAQVLITLIQGVGRPDLSAKLHFVELVVYLPALWWAVHHHGIVGAAIVWSARMAVDGVILFVLATPFLGGNTAPLQRVGFAIGIGLAVLALPLLVPHLIARAVVTAVMLVAFVFVTWGKILSGEERAAILRWTVRR